MQTQPGAILDPENYAKMSVPFNGIDEANEALSAFLAGVRELRNKHRIADVLTIVQVPIKYPDGNQGYSLGTGHNGLAVNAEAMAAYAYGQFKKEREETIGKLMAARGTAMQ